MRSKNNKKNKRQLLSRYPLTVFVAVSLTLLLSLVAIFSSSAPTGMASAPPTFDVSVAEKLDGKITSFSYKNPVDITDRQVMFSEFANTGSVPYDAQTSMTVYYFNMSLQEDTKIEDDVILMNPGARRSFRSEFIPTKTGDYYIKLRVAYQYKVAVLWGYFRVYMTITNEEPINWTDINYTIIYNYTQLPPEQLASRIIEIPANPNMSLEYDKTVLIEKGSRKIIPVKVNNTGDIALRNVKLYISAPSLLYADVNPKLVGAIAQGSSFLFLITLEPLAEMEAGDYNVSFDVISSEATGRASMTVSVVDKLSYRDWQSLADLMLSYNYIASELESKINYMAMYDVDVRAANSTLADAKKSMNSAAVYYGVKDYEKCKSSLDTAGILLESTALQIGNLTLRVYAAQPGFPYLMIVLLVAGICVAVYITYKHEKKKTAKPRFLGKNE